MVRLSESGVAELQRTRMVFAEWQRANDERVALQDAAPAPPTKEEIEKQRKLNELLTANVVFGSASLGGPSKTVAAGKKTAVKPYVCHIVVKDLRRVAHNMNVTLPDSDLFADRSPLALFALFDGQSSANVESPGSQAVEWCCRNIHSKLLKNMSELIPSQTNEMGVTEMLRRSLSEMDQELILEQVGIQDGCGASVALLIGDKLFTAVIGRCGILLCSRQPPIGGKPDGAASASASLGTTASPKFVVRSIGDGHRDQATYPRSLGDRAWKAAGGFAPAQFTQATCSSCVLSHGIDGSCNVLLLVSGPIFQRSPLDPVSELAVELEQRPRAISGEVSARAFEAAALEKTGDGAVERAFPQQFGAVTVVFLPPREIPHELHTLAPKSARLAPPPSKKQKIETGTAGKLRLRHVLVRHADCPAPFDPVRQKPVTRHLSEAEAVLRKALRELLKEQLTTKLPSDPKKAALVHMQPSPRCMALIKEFSECESAQKAGMVCGDLDWMVSEVMRARFGGPFLEAAKALAAGQWSDLVTSDLGVHLLQRIA